MNATGHRHMAEVVDRELRRLGIQPPRRAGGDALASGPDRWSPSSERR